MSDASNKDFAEHLRLTHFSLAAVAIAFTITLSKSSGRLGEDMSAVRNIAQQTAPATGRNGPLGRGLLAEMVRNALEPLSQHPCVEGVASIENAAIRLAYCVPPATVFYGNPPDSRSAAHYAWEHAAYGDFRVDDGPNWHDLGFVPPDGQEHDPLGDFGPGEFWIQHRSSPSTFKSFKVFWDDIGQLVHGYVVSTDAPRVEAFSVVKGEAPDAISIRHIESPLRYAESFPDAELFLLKMPTHWELRPESEPAAEVVARARARVLTFNEVYEDVGTRSYARTAYAFVRPEGADKYERTRLQRLAPGDLVFTFTVPYEHVTLDFRKRLLEQAGLPERDRGIFDTSFSSLADFMKAYDGVDVPLDVLERDVAREVQRADGPIEVLGIKVDRSSVTSWGAAIFAAVQLYFLSHLREWNRRRAAGNQTDASWLPLYRGWLPGVAAWVSTVVLPAVTTVLVLLRARTSGGAVAWIAGGAMIALTVGTALAVHRLRKSLAGPVFPGS